MQRQRARGETLREIAESLNVDRVPTAQGGERWYAAAQGRTLASPGTSHSGVGPAFRLSAATLSSPNSQPAKSAGSIYRRRSS